MKSVYNLTYADAGPSKKTVWKIHKNRLKIRHYKLQLFIIFS